MLLISWRNAPVTAETASYKLCINNSWEEAWPCLMVTELSYLVQVQLMFLSSLLGHFS